MDVTVSGRKMPISDSLRDYAQSKIGGAVEQLDVDAIACEIVLYREKNPANPLPAICEVTVIMKGHVARVEESEEDMFAAIDVAAAKIARQLRKFKTRIKDKRKKKTEQDVKFEREDAHPATELDLDKLMDELSDNEIVRRKKVKYTPLTEEEAMVQMDLLGHDFFVYTDRDSNDVSILYRRSDGSYGLLTPLED
ncbi:MAG: ribosome-associated translation inhibitor RaiA [Eggerthellaceae bacterium]|nr:ribosome-associated translation inhibitor RaiA [Eggerthellaceae bacterium]